MFFKVNLSSVLLSVSYTELSFILMPALGGWLVVGLGPWHLEEECEEENAVI